ILRPRFCCRNRNFHLSRPCEKDLWHENLNLPDSHTRGNHVPQQPPLRRVIRCCALKIYVIEQTHSPNDSGLAPLSDTRDLVRISADEFRVVAHGEADKQTTITSNSTMIAVHGKFPIRVSRGTKCELPVFHLPISLMPLTERDRDPLLARHHIAVSPPFA